MFEVQFDEWEPIYEAILDDFSFDRAADERARDVLAPLTGSFDLDLLKHVRGKRVTIAGAGPSLESPASIDRLRNASHIFAASGAATRLLEYGISIDCMVTDVDSDGEVNTIDQLTARETPVAIHAHGDNIDILRSVVPRCTDAYVLPTTQAAPLDPVINVGGFTDGDRAAFLADELGVSTLAFVGWDFDDSSVTETKAQKLEWARRLLHWLELRRGEQFKVLDGWRQSIDMSLFPSA